MTNKGDDASIGCNLTLRMSASETLLETAKRRKRAQSGLDIEVGAQDDGG
jgi:hypothetical protein